MGSGWWVVTVKAKIMEGAEGAKVDQANSVCVRGTDGAGRYHHTTSCCFLAPVPLGTICSRSNTSSGIIPPCPLAARPSQIRCKTPLNRPAESVCQVWADDEYSSVLGCSKTWKAGYPRGARARLWFFVAGATPLVTNVWQPSPSLAVAEPGGHGRTDGRNVIPDGHVKHQPNSPLEGDAPRCDAMRCDAMRRRQS